MKLMYRVLSLALIALSFTVTSENPAWAKRAKRSGGGSSSGELQAVKRNDLAASGHCLADVGTLQDAKNILARNGVEVPEKANFAEIRSVAIGVQQIELLGGPTAWLLKGVKYRFPKRKSYSEYDGEHINMGANYNDGNVAHVMHELGHYIGNTNGFYERYKAAVEPCYVSRYSRTSWAADRYRNEEFAEVWAAFVTNPGLLTMSRQESCRNAYKFFESQFPRSTEFAICSKEKLNAAVKSPYYIPKEVPLN